jgi:hypothetical protein
MVFAAEAKSDDNDLIATTKRTSSDMEADDVQESIIQTLQYSLFGKRCCRRGFLHMSGFGVLALQDRIRRARAKVRTYEERRSQNVTKIKTFKLINGRGGGVA